MKRAACILACSSILAGAGQASELPGAWRNWRYFRPITVQPTANADLGRVTLPRDVLGRSQESLADLRLIDGAGNELPYVLHARTGSSSQDWRAAALSEVGFVPGEYSQAVADTGQGEVMHNAAEVEVVESGFFTWVEVAASDDRSQWRIVRARAPLYRFVKDGLEGPKTISYPDTRSRWLRLRLLSADDKLTVRQVRVAHERIEEAELVPLSAFARLTHDSAHGESRWEVDLGQAHVPAAAVRGATGRAEFHRPLRVSASADGESWRDVAEHDIYRYGYRAAAGGDEPTEQLLIRFSEARGRTWRVLVFDRNDAPIDDLRLELLGTPRHVVFRFEPGKDYRLLYGNGRAEPAEYDLRQLIARDRLEGASELPLGPEATNEGYVSAEPWTERHPVVLWVALGLAVAVLASLALRALR